MSPTVDPPEKTPEELIEEGYQTIRDNLASELLAEEKTASPQFFERLVVELLTKKGCGGSMKDAGQAIGKSGDEGIDGTMPAPGENRGPHECKTHWGPLV